MKFRMVDRILDCDERSIRTRKTVSFEEFSLLKPWGRKGAFPESLLLQVAVESAALLLARRSSHTRTGVLSSVEELRFERETRPGAVLQCDVEVMEPGFVFHIEDQHGPLAAGRLGLQELPLSQLFDPETFGLAPATVKKSEQDEFEDNPSHSSGGPVPPASRVERCSRSCS